MAKTLVVFSLILSFLTLRNAGIAIDFDLHSCGEITSSIGSPVLDAPTSFCPMEVDELEVLLELHEELSPPPLIVSHSYLGLRDDDFSPRLFKPPTKA